MLRQISKFPCDSSSFDVEYFGQVLAMFCSAIIRRAESYSTLLQELKYYACILARANNNDDIRFKDFYFDAFLDLVSCKDDSSFALRAEEWLMKILNFQNARFIFVDFDKLVIFRRDATYC